MSTTSTSITKANATLVVLNGKRFRHRVDVESRRIWLEDDATKRQWQWRGNEWAGLKFEKGPQIPEREFLVALKHVLSSGSASKTEDVELELEHIANDGLRLVVSVTLATTEWHVEHTFDLAPIPLDASALVQAQHQDMRQSLAAMQRQLVAMERELTTARETDAARHKTITEALTTMDRRFTAAETKREDDDFATLVTLIAVTAMQWIMTFMVAVISNMVTPDQA